MFEPGDWVCLHMRKERFPAQRKSKLHPRGNGPFQVLEKINDNAYKLDLPSEYNVSATFIVSDLSPFDIGADSRMNPFEEGGNNVIPTAHEGFKAGDDVAKRSDPLHVPVGPITRQRAKKIKEAMAGLAQHMVAECDKQTTGADLHHMGFTKEGPKLIHLTQVL